MPRSDYLFHAKTNDGYVVKILAELLHSNIKTACFEISSRGIELCMMDSQKTVLIKVILPHNNFSLYKYKKNEKMLLGINLSNFHKMLKTIKKKDSLELFIRRGKENELGIRVRPREGNRESESLIRIQSIQNMDIQMPEGYGNSIIVPSGEFQKMCKGLAQISNQIIVESERFQIQFESKDNGLVKRINRFGEDDDSDDEEEDKKNTYREIFDSDQLVRITKLSGLSQNIQIYPVLGLPLLFQSKVGSLGDISIYIKPHSIIEAESQTIESDPDE